MLFNFCAKGHRHLDVGVSDVRLPGPVRIRLRQRRQSRLIKTSDVRAASFQFHTETGNCYE